MKKKMKCNQLFKIKLHYSDPRSSDFAYFMFLNKNVFLYCYSNGIQFYLGSQFDKILKDNKLYFKNIGFIINEENATKMFNDLNEYKNLTQKYQFSLKNKRKHSFKITLKEEFFFSESYHSNLIKELS